jgi:hypothetical protein
MGGLSKKNVETTSESGEINKYTWRATFYGELCKTLNILPLPYIYVCVCVCVCKENCDLHEIKYRCV